MYEGVNGNAPKFTRTNSQICPTPEDELLNAVLSNNLDKIEQLVTRNEHLLSHTYPDYDKRILLIACSEDGVEAKTVEKLLNLKANPRDYSDEGWEALHWAAHKTDPTILKVLLDRNPGDVNVVDSHGNSALQVLIRHGATDSLNFLECARLLIQKGADVRLTDSKNKNALDWAKKRGVVEQIQRIIDQHGPLSGPLVTNNNFDAAKNQGEELFKYLKLGNENGFIQYRNGDIGQWVNYENASTLLQFCCEKSLNRAALHLLSQGADHEKTGIKNSTKPIVIAAEQGNCEIFKALLDKYSSLASVPEGLLPICLKYSHNVGFQECFKMYMDKIRTGDPDEISMKLNEKDKNGNTALKYAIRYGNSKTVQDLLDCGASLGAKNQYGIMPIHDIKPELLEKHLDNCVMFDVKSTTKVENEDFQITFNYRTLVPPYAKPRSESGKDVEAAGMTSLVIKERVDETEVISFMANSSEYKHLLKHPVIVSFLLMKWLKIQCLFWANLSFYVTFVLSLVIYIFTDYAYFVPGEKSTIHSMCASLSYACLTLTLLVLIIREVFQICVAPNKYFKNFENYVEIILIVFTSMIVFTHHPTVDSRKQLSSLAILLAVFELVLMSGQHPYLSTNVVMLKTVSFNFFKFLIWYSFLIVAFALSFYLLFTTSASNPVEEVKNQTANENPEDDKSFDGPGRSVFKTIIMLTGEFDASSINFDTFPVTSKIIFALFIFMIAIILLNLLNGLAVSDTQMIKNNAELVGYIARAQHIRYVESMFMGNVLPTTILNKIRDLCCCLPLDRSCNIKIAQACCPNVCLFPDYLNYELVFFPNKSGLVACNHEEKKLKQGCLPCSSIYLDRETVRRANGIVQKKIEEEHTTDANQRLEQEISELKDKLDEILRSLNSSITSSL